MAKKTHYRVLRSTIVLALASDAYAAIRTPELTAAVDTVVAANYQFDQVQDDLLELIFAYFDADFTARVLAEFRFVPSRDNVRVHPKCEAICTLCGKGDSKEEGGNVDFIRFEYRLDNRASGREVWCGKTCIIKYGLRVDGAATSDEARGLLERSMREALRQWEINEWRLAHSDHGSMQDEYQAFRGAWYARPYDDRRLLQYRVELLIGGVAPVSDDSRNRATRAFKNAVSFYLRNGFLTDNKQHAWDRAREIIAADNEGIDLMRRAFQERATMLYALLDHYRAKQAAKAATL